MILKKSRIINYNSNVISYILFKKSNIFITLYRIESDNKNNKKFLKMLYSSSCGTKLFKNTNKLSVGSVKLLFFKFIFFLIKNNLYLIDLIIDGKNYYSDSIISYIFKIKLIDSAFKINCISRYYKFPYNGCRLKKYRFL